MGTELGHLVARHHLRVLGVGEVDYLHIPARDQGTAVLARCGGAYPDSGLKIGDLALANAEVFGDEGVVTHEGFSDFSEMKIRS